MKKLILINGTMGAGKTTTCQELLKILQPSVFLDGDWCWKMHPFIGRIYNLSATVYNSK